MKYERGARLPVWLTVLWVAALLGGCVSQEKDYRLTLATEAYNKSIRWGNYTSAIAQMHESARPDPRQMNFQLERFAQVQVTGYALLGQEPSGSEDVSIRIMELRVVNRHTMQERIVQDRQEWRYFPDQGVWYQMSGLPDLSRK